MAGTVKTEIDVLHTDIVFISENISKKTCFFWLMTKTTIKTFLDKQCGKYISVMKITVVSL